MKQLKKYWKVAALSLLVMAMASCVGDDDTEEVEYTPEAETEQLDALLQSIIDNGYDVDTTELGVYYVMSEIGEGAYPQPGDSLGVAYTGYFVNGSVFDSSEYSDDGLWHYVLGEVTVIPGFEDAINHLREGGSGTFIIPSSLAYGPTGTYGIPPYTTLVFDLELSAIYPEE